MIQIAKHSVAWVVLAAAAGAANAQQASGPVVKMTAVNQAAISQPQFTEVDVVRHHLVAKIVHAYDKRDRETKKPAASDRTSSH